MGLVVPWDQAEMVVLLDQADQLDQADRQDQADLVVRVDQEDLMVQAVHSETEVSKQSDLPSRYKLEVLVLPRSVTGGATNSTTSLNFNTKNTTFRLQNRNPKKSFKNRPQHCRQQTSSPALNNA